MRVVKDTTTIKVIATKKSKVLINKTSTTTHPYNVKSNVNNGGTKRSTIAEKVKKDAPINSTARLGTFNSRKTNHTLQRDAEVRYSTQTSMTTKMSTTGKKTDKTIATNQESKKSITIATKKKKVPTKESIKNTTAKATKATKENTILSPSRSSTRNTIPKA